MSSDIDNAIPKTEPEQEVSTEEKPESSQPPPPAKQTIRSCLHKLLRVTLTDGRTVEGNLECYDNHANMILSDAIDISGRVARPFGRTVRLGTVLVPGDAAQKVLAWREKNADTGEIVERTPERRVGAGDAVAVGEDSDDEIGVLAEGFEGIRVGR